MVRFFLKATQMSYALTYCDVSLLLSKQDQARQERAAGKLKFPCRCHLAEMHYGGSATEGPANGEEKERRKKKQ
jgi:hypothetical protein